MADERLRSWLAAAGKQAGARISVGLHKTLGSRAGGGFPILMYHRVAPVRSALAEPTWNVTPERFREQMETLRVRGYQPISLRSAIERATAAGTKAIAPKTVVVTFDDGYLNSYVHVLPVLRELRIPATVFVATSYVDSEAPLPFDSWGLRHHPTAPREDWQALTWSQCREMEASGVVEIGSHSHRHVDFRGDSAAFSRDLADSLSALRERLGRDTFTFSFPYGSRRLGYASDSLMRMACESGALCALTTETELARPDRSPFGWGRLEIVNSDTADMLEAKVAGWYNWMGSMRELFRTLMPPRAGVSEGSIGPSSR